MKKLVAFFIILISLTVLIGCGSKTTINPTSQNNGTKTTVTTIEQDKTTTTATTTADTTAKKAGSTTPADTTTSTSSDSTTVDKSDVQFAIISMINNKLDTTKSYNVISGVTPKTTAKITINNYNLSKYVSGSTKWSYIAATSLNNLKKGENNYAIIAYDSKGNTIASRKFTINYTGSDSTSLASTGSNGLMISLITSLTAGTLYIRRRRIA